jgi:hypothetical protein
VEVSETLKRAWTAVQEAGLPEQMHGVAFREAVRLLAPDVHLASKKLRTGSASAEGSGGASGSGGPNDAASGVTEEQMYERVVQQTGVDRDKLEKIVHLDDDGPKVSIAGIKLGKNNAERARVVAQILTIVRGFGLGESEIPLEVIRTECDRLKVYDSANFSSHMKALSGYVINGVGQNRRLRPKGQGIGAFSGLVSGLLGSE